MIAVHRPLGPVLSSRQFWDLMERWRVPDASALELIEYPGKLGASGKRPRFRFTTRQQRITSYLPEIDTALTAAGKDPGWLHRKIPSAPFFLPSADRVHGNTRNGWYGGGAAPPE
jgi:hypothetical protein